MDQTLYVCIRRFLKESKPFTEQNNQQTTNALNDCLEIISKLDFSTVSCEKVEVSLFFSKLWEIMSHSNGPHSAGVSVLLNACRDPPTLYALIHNYKFFPLLAEYLLHKSMSMDNKIKLLTLMEDLSQGIKINWREDYLSNLLETLWAWIMELDSNMESKHFSKTIFVRSLSILVNLCYKNMFVTSLLEKTVDTRIVIKHLHCIKDNASASVQICRLLMSLNNIKGLPMANDVHNYLRVALYTFVTNIRKLDENELRYTDILIGDLCTNPLTKPHVITYDHFEISLQEALKSSSGLFSIINDSSKKCISFIFNILLNIVKLEIFSIRECHKMIANLCVNASSLQEVLGPGLSLLAAIVSNYEEDGMLPDDLMPTISIGFNALLDPVNLDPKTAGLDWMRFVSSLCDCHATREAVFANVNPEKFEDLFKKNLQYHVQNSNSRDRHDQEVVMIACHICLSLADLNNSWVACLHRILSNSSVTKVMNHCISNTHNLRKKQFLRIIRHPNFPIDKINDMLISNDAIIDCNVSLDILNNSNGQVNPNTSSVVGYNASPSLSSSQQRSVDDLIKKINDAYENDKISSIPASNLMQLYGYKMTALEHRLNCSTASLQSANKSVVVLNHSISMLQATNQNQEDLLYTTQSYNERLEERVARLSEQINDAEKTIKKFQGKLASEKLHNERQFANSHLEFTQKIKNLESQIMKNNEVLEQVHSELNITKGANANLTDKLNDEVKKNTDLAGLLNKFEDRVKQREKKLEEANQHQSITKLELEQAQLNIKNLEKTLLERDKRLTQVTTQLEEMNRIQEMIANLMGSKGSTNVSTNSMS